MIGLESGLEKEKIIMFPMMVLKVGFCMKFEQIFVDS